MLAEQLLQQAQATQDFTLLLAAHQGLGAILHWSGELALARTHLEHSIALSDLPHDPSGSALLPGVSQATSLCILGWVLWCLGYPDQALTKSHEASALARALSDPHRVAFTLTGTAITHQLRREGQAAQEYAEATVSLCQEQGFGQYLAVGMMVRGWALVEQGQREEGFAQIRQGLAASQAAETKVFRPYDLALLAEAYRQEGQLEEGLRELAKALRIVQEAGQHFYEAELYRLRGELTLQEASQKSKDKSQKSKVETDPRPLTPDPYVEAEACFHKAIEIARKQQAKSLELRAATSLARLWQQQDKHHEAHQMLSEIYTWFTEGFDTKDLQEAKALLDELSD